MLSIKSNSITEGMIMAYIGEGIVGLGAVAITASIIFVIYVVIIYSKLPKK